MTLHFELELTMHTPAIHLHYIAEAIKNSNWMLEVWFELKIEIG
jgi:hypothetical protein